MDFGSWVQSLRSSRAMDVRTFARLVGVDASTISRIEQARTQVTVLTAVRICEGVGTAPADLLSAMRGERPKWARRQPDIHEDVVITIKDLEALLCFLRLHWEEGCRFLTNLLNRIAASERADERLQEETTLLIVPKDIEKLLADSPLYHFKVHYPEEMKAEEIWKIYLAGGALSLVDIGIYLRQVRRDLRVTLSGLEESGKLSASVLSRLEGGTLERVKLIDVLTLDEQLGQEGKILAMYWRACTLMEMVMRVRKRDSLAGVPMPAALERIEQDLKMVELFLTICRWFSCLSASDHGWITEVRRRLHCTTQVAEDKVASPLS
jgi:transcriptional regulator with XRE-family HTH domain